jgi:outer membrane receptor protein involved in Fe transport
MLSDTTAAAFQRPNILRRCLARAYPARRPTLRGQARTLLVLFACLFSFTAFAVDLERKVDFDIPAQSLSAALIQFSHQAKIQVIASDNISQQTTQGITGQHTVREALKQLLGATGLGYRVVGDSSITIVRDAKTTLSTSGGAGAETAAASYPTGTAAGASQGTVLEGSVVDKAVLEEVIVTANKRSERLADVPMSAVVLSGQRLTESQATTLQDIVNRVPGLQLVSDSPVDNQLIIRGISIGFGAINSSVATYVDEVPYTSEGPFAGSSNLAPNLDTYDLARVEVLRGPQGTVYGANALGGLLKYVTNLPDPTQFSASFLTGVSSALHGGVGYEAHGMVNLPLSDTLALRVVANDNRFPGYIDDPSRGQSQINSVDRYGGRASLLWQAESSFSVRLTAQYQHLEAHDTGDVDVYPGSLQPIFGDLKQEKLIAQPQRVDNEIYNATINWDLGRASLTSSTSYSEANPTLTQDLSWALGSYVSSLLGANYGTALATSEPVHSFTQEVRLAWRNDATWDWMVGGYFTDEGAHEIQATPPIDLNTGRILYNLQSSLGVYDITSTYRELAAFGDVNYHITPAFEVGLGGRYSSEKQSYHQQNDGLVTGTNNFTTHSDQDAFTYSADAKYKFNPEAIVYLRVASGFVPGGPNDALPGSPLPETFHSSTTTNYEGGIKGAAMDGRLNYDFDVFDVEWKDIQLIAAINGLYGVTNGGAARSRGVEGAVSYVPIHGLFLSANAAYTDARLTQDTPASVNGIAGDRLPESPFFSSTLSASYEHPLSSAIVGFGGIDWHYTGDRLSEFAVGAPRQTLPSYSMVDLRAGVRVKAYELTLYVKNAGDARAISEVSAETVNGLNAYSASLVTPRTIGLTLSGKY